jgi:hypothetical protein
MCNSVLMDEDKEAPDLGQIDTPASLRPDLSELGIEEVDRGICLDLPENRHILRKHKLSWIAMYDSKGFPTNTIEVRSQAMIEARGMKSLEGREELLTDPNDLNSDYATGLELLYAVDSETLIPSWVMSATRTWLETEKKRNENPGKKVRPSLVEAPGRCKQIKSDGVRCSLWTAGRSTDMGYCRIHLGSLTMSTAGAIEKARQRVAQSAPAAADVMEEMLHATSEVVRLNAAKELLDRAGVRGGVEVDVSGTVEHRPAGELVAERLRNLAESKNRQIEMEARVNGDSSDILDVEVLPDDEADDDDE